MLGTFKKRNPGSVRWYLADKPVKSWGVGIFENEDASNIIDVFDKGKEQKRSVDEITDTVINDPSFREQNVTYLTLAVIQLTKNDLQTSIRNKALEYLTSGDAMKESEDYYQEQYLPQRKEILEMLTEVLKVGRGKKAELRKIAFPGKSLFQQISEARQAGKPDNSEAFDITRGGL